VTREELALVMLRRLRDQDAKLATMKSRNFIPGDIARWINETGVLDLAPPSDSPAGAREEAS
jgi:hypothetical protein